MRRTNHYVPHPQIEREHGYVRSGGHVAHLYSREVSPRVREVLIKEGLVLSVGRHGQRSPAGWGEWISMDPMMAWAYKCALTSELARRERLVPTTDQVAAHQAGHEWDAARIEQVLLRRREAVSREAESPAVVLGELAVQMVVPENVADIPVAKNLQTPALAGASLGAIGGLAADQPYVVAAAAALGFVAHRHTVGEQRRAMGPVLGFCPPAAAGAGRWLCRPSPC